MDDLQTSESRFSYVVRALELAANQDSRILFQVESQLKEWELQPQFYPLLLSIYFNRTLDVQVRWMAILYLKNGIDKYWRKSSIRMIQEEEKAILRSQLISSFNESIPQLSVQVAVVISKIAKQDISNWPELIPTVLQAVRSQDKVTQHQALLVLNHIIKGLLSKRLASDRQIFREVSSNIIGIVVDLWLEHTNQVLTHLSEQQWPQAATSLDMGLLSIKVLRKLLVGGFRGYSEDSIEVKLLHLLLERLPTLLECRANYTITVIVIEKIEKLIITSMKVLLNAQDQQPLSFVPVLEKVLKLAVSQIFSTHIERPFVMLKIQCSNLIRSIIRCKDYQMQKNSDKDNTNPETVKAYQIKQRLLTPEVLAEFCRRLIQQYFPLTQEDLEEWEADPEGYVAEETGESFKYMIRPSTECLFLSLFYESRNSVTPVMKELVRSLNGPTQSDHLQSILERDAVYYAVGLASYELFDEVDFDRWFQETLVKELINKGANMKIIRQRVIWLIGKWVNVKLARKNRPALYQRINCLLNQDEDLVVRLTAAKALKEAIDDFEFRNEDFEVYIEEACRNLFHLLIQVRECDTKISILSVISILIERVASQIRPHVNILLNYLPHLWQDSSEHNMLRCAVLSTLTQLVQGLGSLSSEMHPFVLPMIELSTDINKPPHVYLLEDGLQLWQNLLQNTPRMTNDLLSLYSNMPSLLDRASENLRICASITESYILLDASSFLQVYSSALSGIITSLLGELKMEGNIIIASLIELVMIIFPDEGAQLFKANLLKLIGRVLADEDYQPLMSSYLSVFGYLIVNNATSFFQLIDQHCRLSQGQQPEDIAGQFLDIWLEKVDGMTKPEIRKLTVLALCTLLPCNVSFVNERFAIILDTAVNVLYDIEKSIYPDDEAVSASQATTLETADQPHIIDETQESKRRRELRAKDPVHKTALLQFIKFKLQETQTVLGDMKFQECMEMMDTVVAQQLMTFIR